jgi:hypothetical protein
MPISSVLTANLYNLVEMDKEEIMYLLNLGGENDEPNVE